MKKFFGLCVAIAALTLGSAANADFFSGGGPGGAIPDGSGTAVSGAPFLSTIVVPGTVQGTITDVNISFNALAHSWVGDVTMTLTHPDGITTLTIMSRPGRGNTSTFGFSSDFVAGNSYAFADFGVALFNVAPPAIIPTGTYIPSSNPNPPATNALPYVYTPTSFFGTFGGLLAPGIWTLEIRDWAGGDTGSLGGWTLNITTQNVIPEPSSLAILSLLGVAGLVVRRRR